MDVIENIKKELGANYRENTDEIISMLYDKMSSIASNISRLQKDNELLYPYIENAVISKYNQLGAEGMNTKSEGSESYSFIDVEEKLRNDIIKNGLRRIL